MLLVCCVTLFAQQALWGGAAVVSPDIHDDNTVTFRLKAPKAVRVQITGDFLPPQTIKTPRGDYDAPGIADLTEGKDGVWEFTTPEPLKPELYGYSFIVDGLRMMDPSNVYMIRDVATVTNVFIIGGDRADLYKVNKVPHGTVSRMWYNSPSLGMDRRLRFTLRLVMKPAASVIRYFICFMVQVVMRKLGLLLAVLRRYWIISLHKARLNL
mgnify:FL=1